MNSSIDGSSVLDIANCSSDGTNSGIRPSSENGHGFPCKLEGNSPEQTTSSRSRLPSLKIKSARGFLLTFCMQPPLQTHSEHPLGAPTRDRTPVRVIDMIHATVYFVKPQIYLFLLFPSLNGKAARSATSVRCFDRAFVGA